ncbi:MAG: alpha/beta hydrolase, partial [Bacteroidaceae bacterium]|nr:alpha/beta hydrolase [Bacteroidaceae bacterium]
QHPMLFIHGDNDTYVPTSMIYPLYEAHPGPKEMWLAPGSEHADAYKDHPEEYTAKVKAFVDQYIQ